MIIQFPKNGTGEHYISASVLNMQTLIIIVITSLELESSFVPAVSAVCMLFPPPLTSPSVGGEWGWQIISFAAAVTTWTRLGGCIIYGVASRIHLACGPVVVAEWHHIQDQDGDWVERWPSQQNVGMRMDEIFHICRCVLCSSRT